jgi:aryl-alcohol dehydrogenase
LNLISQTMAGMGCGICTGAGAVLNSLKVDAGSSIAVTPPPPSSSDVLKVFGCGSVGLAAVMAAKVAGATTIIAVDLNDDRLKVKKRALTC